MSLCIALCALRRGAQSTAILYVLILKLSGWMPDTSTRNWEINLKKTITKVIQYPSEPHKGLYGVDKT